MINEVKSLTIYERHITYIRALHIFKTSKIANIGFCYCLNQSRSELIREGSLESSICISTSYNSDFEQCYPEIYKYKPKNITSWTFWFKFNKYGKQKRINIVKEAIKLTNII